MSQRNKWICLIIMAITGLIILSYALHRDVLYERAYTGDLRNRIVGARMIADGQSPYFYKWKKGDTIRYYDPTNFDTLKASVNTSTPFLHRVFYPIADLPQNQISKVWLAAEYLLFIGMAMIAFSKAKSQEGKIAVVLFFLLFLLTNAWKKQTALGQTYILIPTFAMLFYWLFQKKTTLLQGILTGTAAACLVLSKPNAIFFFLPFMFLLRYYRPAWLLAFFMPTLLVTGWILADKHERQLWWDYKDVVAAYTNISQGRAALQTNDPDPQFPIWEGVDRNAAAEQEKHMPAPIYSENGNVFVIWLLITHHRLPVPLLEGIGLTLILLLTGLFYTRNRPIGSNPLHPVAYNPTTGSAISHDTIIRIAIFGFCLYMISDLFSPVYRHQYYTVQWIFPLLLAAALYKRDRPQWPYYWLLACLLLSIVHISFLRMQNTMAEYGFLAILLVFSGLSGERINQDATPISLS